MTHSSFLILEAETISPFQPSPEFATLFCLCEHVQTDKALMAEKVVDKGLQVLSLTLPPLTAVLATDFSRDKLGVQVSLMAACLASLVPALLLGTWSWARSRMAVRVSEATKRMQLAVSCESTL